MRFTILFIFVFMLQAAALRAQSAAPAAAIPSFQATVKTPTNKLENSIQFYTKLGFKPERTRPLSFTDGKVVIEIDSNKFARAGFNFYKPSWKEEVAALKATHNIIAAKNGYMLTDPSGVWIYLVESDYQPPKHADSSYSALGNYQGITLETGNIIAAYNLYTTLGMQKVGGKLEREFVVLSNGNGFGIVLVGPNSCPHLFFNPSMTYFNGKRNPEIIKRIRKLNITPAQEITWFSKVGAVDNIIIRDPGGYGFFIFND